MPRPTGSTSVQRPDLGAIAYEYMLEASRRGFIGLELMPIFDTPLQSAKYPVIPIEALLKRQETRRAPRANYNRGDWEFEDGTFACQEYGWEEPVDDVEASLFRRFFDAEEIAVKRAVDFILRGQESRIAGKVFNTSNITNNAAVSVKWDVAATAEPRDDVYAAKEAMRKAVGFKGNILTMSETVFNNLLFCQQVTDALKYTNPLEMGGLEAQRAMLAKFLGVDRILVAGAMEDTAKKGQSASLSDIWGSDYVGLFKVSGGGQDLKEPCIGRTFLWTEDSPQNLVTESYREEQSRSNIYRTRHNVDEAFVFTGAGYLLTGVTTPEE